MVTSNENISFQVNFKYVNNQTGALRNGAIVVDAKNSEAAKKAASEKLALQFPNAKITRVSLY